MPSIRKVSANCPICKNQIEVDVNTELVENATNYPISIAMQHGKPSHTMVVFIDADYRVRGVDGYGLVVTEDKDLDAMDLALAERKSLNRLAEIPGMLDGLKSILGIEYADNKGVAIVSLSSAGPTIGTITSPTGRLKGRFVIQKEQERLQFTTAFSGAFSALDDAPPLSPATLVLLLKVIEESISINHVLSPTSIKRIAESTSLTPFTELKSSVFNVMCQHSLTDQYGAKEIELISDRLDGKSSLLSLIRLVEKQGLSILKLLICLEILSKNDTITLRQSEDLSKR